MREQLLHPLEGFLGRLAGLVRVNAHARENVRPGLREPDTRFEIGRPGPNRQHLPDARFERPLDHRLSIRVELRIVEMAMGIDHCWVSFLIGRPERPPQA